MTEKVSLIMTVRNEADSITAVLGSLARQTRQPDEVVICDGGSTDATVRIIEQFAAGAPWPLRLVIRPGSNISAGRNAAIAAAEHPIIAATDAGVRLPENWLQELLAPFEDFLDSVDISSGFFAPDPQTVFERAMGATVLPALEDVDPDKFLPSSRSAAFRKTAWEQVGGYPEWLDYSEDLVFDLALKQAGCRFAFAPRAVALFRPRSNLRSFFKQYYLYARGDGKADLWRLRHAIRYATYLFGPLSLILARRLPLTVVLPIFGALLYCRTPWKRLRPWLHGLAMVDAVKAIGLVPVIRVTGDVAKMIGYPVGVWWRLRHRR